MSYPADAEEKWHLGAKERGSLGSWLPKGHVREQSHILASRQNSVLGAIDGGGRRMDEQVLSSLLVPWEQGWIDKTLYGVCPAHSPLFLSGN